MPEQSPVRRWVTAALPVTPLLRWAVLVHAVPAGEPWRTGCPSCDAPVSLTAGLGAALPAGRCGSCGQRAGARPYLVELATAAAAALVLTTVLVGGWSPGAAVALAGWALAAVPLVFVDLAVHRLPDRFTLPAAGWVIGWLGLAAATGDASGSWTRAVAAGLACALGFALFAVLPRRMGYGLGDAKLALGAGALLGWWGWGAVLAGLFLAFLTNALVATGLLVTRRVGWRDAIPFGPYLVAGTLAALTWAAAGTAAAVP